jgi:glycosyltransferase involved in cell wall biosynthesis
MAGPGREMIDRRNVVGQIPLKERRERSGICLGPDGRSSQLDKITVLILTYDESPNIARTLSKLGWAGRIVVVDSFSTDETCMIAQAFDNVEVFQRRFDCHSQQWNFGIDCVDSEWVLALDADYQLSDDFSQELEVIAFDTDVDAYYVRFRYCVAGRPLRASLYPPRAVLFRRSKCHYQQDGHTQVLRIDGRTDWLRSYIDHDDRKPLRAWLTAQDRYAELEAWHLLERPPQSHKIADRVRLRIVPAPLLVFAYTLVGKGLILDGRFGLYYVLQRTVAEIILSLRLIEFRCFRRSPKK